MATKHASALDELLPGIQQSFSDVFKSHYKQLCLYAFQFVKDKPLAEDIVQTCFAKLWTKRYQIDFSGSPTSFLYTMVRNAAFDYLRTRKPSADREELELIADNSAMQEMILTETLQEIYSIAEFLPPRCLDIFRMLFIHGKDHSEVAHELHISESTIRTQKAKAISFIRLNLLRFPLAAMFFLG